MRSERAIFVKQAKDILHNPMVLIEFIIFPAVAWLEIFPALSLQNFWSR